jgi:hypothetical protein
MAQATVCSQQWEALVTSTPMTNPPNPPNARNQVQPPPPLVPPRLPLGTVLLAGLLLAIPVVALAIVPVYAKATPKLWGFPFFYWYQFVWVLATAVLTYTAYLLITRARRGGGSR